jgi:HK97 family phage portal protein
VETAEQRAARVEQLERSRAERRGLAAQEPTGPVEVAPGRGDLNRVNVPQLELGGLAGPMLTPQARTLYLVDGRPVSYSRIFAEQPWVAAAVMRILTWAVRVPLKVYRRTGDDSRVRLRAEDHALAAAIDQPWEGGYPAALTMALLGPLLVHGNSVTEVDEGRSGAIQFRPLDWNFLTPIQSSRDTVDGWTVAADFTSGGGLAANSREVSADTVIHGAWWSPLGPYGISPLRQLGTTIAIEDAAQRWQRAIFRNAARPPSAIQASTEFLGLDKDTRDILLEQLREDVTALYAGPDNQGRPALLPPGLEWNPIGHTAVEAELVNQRYIDREETCAVYQIPPPMLGDLRRATFANITELRQVAYTDGLGPPLVLLEQIITARILRFLLREDDTYVEFDFSGVLRGDSLKEINALRAAVGMGMMTPNEARSARNLPRSSEPRADELWMPWNNLQPMNVQNPPAAGGPNRAQRRGADQQQQARLHLPAGVRADRVLPTGEFAREGAAMPTGDEEFELEGASA